VLGFIRTLDLNAAKMRVSQRKSMCGRWIFVWTRV